MKIKRLVPIVAVVTALTFSACQTGGRKIERISDDRELTVQEYSVYNTVGRDALGRVSLPVDGVKADKDRYVGLFYFMIHNTASDMTGIYNVTEILNQYGRDFFNTDTETSPGGACHLWGEPVWGYYSTPDEWVMRKQIEMFAFSGIDFLVLDCSNGPLYFEATDMLYRLLLEYRAKGWTVPKIVYQLNGGGDLESDKEQLYSVYDRYYSKAEYNDVWFAPHNKPVIINLEKTQVFLEGENATEKDRALREFFEMRSSYWPTDWSNFDNNSAPWMDFEIEPRVMGGWVSASVSQHVTSMMSDTEGARGRGWTITGGNDHENYGAGANFENQWNNVLNKDAEAQFVFVTGWNEFGAQKTYLPHMDSVNKYVMCDQFNAEYSRDIEPTYTAGMKDNFYLQNMRKLREWKCTPSRHYEIPLLSPTGVNDVAWEQAAVYTDFTGEAIERNAPRFDYTYGKEKVMLTDKTGRNDIETVRVARDDTYLYFKISVAGDAITPYSEGDGKWMNIHIRMAEESNAAWGYTYTVCNRGSVVRNTDGKTIGSAETVVSGKEMTVKIPLKMLGLKRDDCSVEFKVTDNVTDATDVLSCYNSGDSAPIGGLSWSFGY